MEFHFLGTGSGVPALQRNVSALAIRFLQQKGMQWLFDCGEATQHQLLHSPITLAKIERIFISHLHGDHIFGLPGVLGSRSFQGSETPLILYGPKGLEAFVYSSLQVSNTHLRFPLQIIEIEEGFRFQTDELEVEVIELDHGMPSYAFKIRELDKPGTLNVEALKKMGVMPGPIYQQLKEGKVLTLDDGQVVEGKDFVGPAKLGRTIIVGGDTRPLEKMIDFAKGADVLIHEATFRHEKASHARQYGHSTVRQAAEIANKAEVELLILTHISSRYAGQEQEIEEEARRTFTNTIIAYDQMIYSI
ncbi:ribonuclease Z [Bacillus solitudinis]|uniref:ribonuclease Z n=1 Tax=Bacillus solitudinis TaxID=2014074 RepID=UPI000C234FE4|nr:ribonuclease Z [Bacillus solitudinis]